MLCRRLSSFCTELSFLRCLSYSGLETQNKHLSMPKRPRPQQTRGVASGGKKSKLDTNTTSSAAFSLSSMKFTYSPNPELVGTSTLLSTPDKSATDKKTYRALRLRNGLRVLLISDASYPLEKLDEEEALAAAADTTEDEEEEEDEDGGGEEESSGEESDEEDDEDEEEDDEDFPMHRSSNEEASSTGLKLSAAALSVNIGSFSDPDGVPGMAHFLEHMVFMGSAKYPDENSFDAFNRKYGGFDNASTDCETTTFYFETPRRNFLEGLDRFAQFFISPLMKKESMQREREAVDSEFDMCVTSDYNRIAQIYGGIAQGHPMAKFMWGNTKSLTPDFDDEVMHKKLHDFRDRHYSAQFMTLAVQSQHTLDTMQEWIESIYSSVPNNGLSLETFHHLDKPFSNSRFHKLYRLHPVQNVYQIDLTWSLPNLMDKYRTKPLHYLSWVIGHEGKGSLLSYLRKKVWALSLCAGNEGDGFEFNSTCSMFTITVVLTKNGYEEIENVLSAVFSYLSMMKTEGPNQRIFNEMKEIERLDFTYQEETQPSENVETLSENMLFLPPERFLDGDDLLFDYDGDLIKKCMDALVFDEVNMFLKSGDIPEEELDQLEPWFSTKYSELSIPDSWAAACKDTSLTSEFHLPEPNIYIAEDLTIRGDDMEPSTHPVKLIDDSLGELFYKKDNTFLQPRTYTNYFIRSALPQQTIENAILLDLMVNCLDQLMVEDVYPAGMNHFTYSVQAAENGLVFKIGGLSDKLPRLLETVLKHLTSLEENIDQDLFTAVREQTRRNYYNYSIKPSKLVRDLRLAVLQNVFWTAPDKHNLVRSLTLPDLHKFIKAFFTNGYLQGLIQGNITSSQARQIDEMVRKYIQLKPLECMADTETRCNEVPPETHYLQTAGLNRSDANTLVTNYYQARPGNIREHAILDVATMLMEEPVFDVLRTQEQLGYSVYNSLRNTHGVLGFTITVNTQATKYTADHVDQRIDNFLKMFLENHVTKEKVETIKTSLVKIKTRADVKLQEELDRHWGEITSREYNFDRRDKEVKAINTLGLEDVLDYFKPLLQNEAKCRKLSVRVIGHKEKAEEAEDEENRVFDINLETDKKATSITDMDGFRAKLKTFPVLYIID